MAIIYFAETYELLWLYKRASGSIVLVTEMFQGVEISASSRVAGIVQKQHKLFTVVG